MTIAMCYVLHEGVVLGADSTTSFNQGSFHYYNHNQKLFEVGPDGTLGILTWGLGGLSSVSHRTLIANIADEFAASPPGSVQDAASRWIDRFFEAYDKDQYLQIFRQLASKAPHRAGASPDPGTRTKQEEDLHEAFRTILVTGFCLGGRLGADRSPYAFEIIFDPLKGKPVPTPIPVGQYRFWGAPNMVDRLINGYDSYIRDAIVGSPHWSGTADDLSRLLAPHRLEHPAVPIRDAVDFVHTCIHSTIKALKFSTYSQICGGPIELAVVTTDRSFRWVRHKRWDAAILEGESL